MNVIKHKCTVYHGPEQYNGIIKKGAGEGEGREGNKGCLCH